MQRPKDRGGAQLCPNLATRAGLPVMARLVEKQPGALTCQEEEGSPRDGNAALGDGVAVSDPGALHADDTEDHSHEAQEHGHHHQSSC